MKTDKKLWLAIILLIILVTISIVLSIMKNDSISSLQREIQDLKQAPQVIPQAIRGADGHTPILGVDYQNGATGSQGDTGSSAYQVALLNGFKGTEKQWLESLRAKPAKDGTNGKSAYQLAVDAGFKGTQHDWLESLKASPAPDLIMDCVDGHWSKKYDGDSFWQVTKIRCEVDNE